MYKLSPSDFAYLYEECKLCYCLKVKHGIYQPSMPMPGVFSAINTRLQGGLVGKDLQTLAKDLPEGKVVVQEGWVESRPVPGTNVYIKGKYDLLVKRPDGTHIFKQIGPVERRRFVGVLSQDSSTQSPVVVCGDCVYKVLAASVSYFKIIPGDEVVILLPAGGTSVWAAVERLNS